MKSIVEFDTIKRGALAYQKGGTHYKEMPLEPWQIIEANNLNFWEGNALKYILRHRLKNGVEDLEKAAHYLRYLTEKTNSYARLKLEISSHEIAKVNRLTTTETAAISELLLSTLRAGSRRTTHLINAIGYTEQMIRQARGYR